MTWISWYLLRPDVDKYNAYFDLGHSLAKTLGISEDRIDLLFINLDDADPVILYNAINRGVLLKDSDSNILGDRIDLSDGLISHLQPFLSFRNMLVPTSYASARASYMSSRSALVVGVSSIEPE